MRFVDELLIKYARKLEDENAPELITVAMREGAEAIRQLDEEVKFLREVLQEIATYKIEEGCPCNACQYSALARFALDWKHD